MKLYTATNKLEEGTVSISIGGGNHRLFHFPIDSLFDWYPCSPRYTYQYSTSRKRFYLRISESDRTLPHYYGVTSNSKRASSKIACFKEKEWYNKEVAEENRKLFEFAKQYDIVTPLTEGYTLEQVDKSIAIVLDILDFLYEKQKEEFENELIDNVNRVRHLPINSKQYKEQTKELLDYSRLPREEKATQVLQDLSDDAKAIYDKFGCVYTMLNIMRKVVE